MAPPADIRFRLLGPVEADRDGGLLALGGPKQRIVLAALLLEAGRVVPVDRLVALVWGEEVPDRASETVQVYVSNLRRVIRGEREGADAVLVGRRPGYTATVAVESLDVLVLADLLGQARRARAGADGAAAAHLLRLADGLWRGPALADLRDVPGGHLLAAPLDRQRAELRREMFEVDLDLGRHRQLVPELEAAVASEPYDEALAGLLALALYRSGRQADALAAVRATGQRLADDLGLDPGAELRALEAALLRQEPGLDAGEDLDLTATRERHDRGRRGAVLVLPNGAELELGARTWVIGRHPGCQVVLSDPESSRRHAEIRPVSGGYLLVDLGSTNGTRVEDEEIREHHLLPGQRIAVGTTTLIYREV